MKKFRYLVFMFIFGGAIALIGWQGMDTDLNIAKESNRLAKLMSKQHGYETADVFFALHGKHTLEYYAKNPRLVGILKENRDLLKQSDRNALNILIDKVTTK